MIVVLDSSAAAEIVLNRESAKSLKEIIGSSERVITTALYRVEVINLIRAYHEGKYIERKVCDKLLELAERLVDEFAGFPENNTEVLNDTIRLKQPVNDVLYLGLARRTGAALVSMDKKLKALAGKEGITVIE
jgi:predicted nucleic acid-binding protein